MGKSTARITSRRARRHPNGQVCYPEEDIGKTAVFLASEDSKYITVQTLMVDGGSIILH